MLRRFFRRAAPASPAPRASLPESVRVYAVGDVHGRSDLLDGVLAGIDRHRRDSPPARCIEVYLGDYVDRGPDSPGVLDRMAASLEAQEPDRTVVALWGNHEEMMCSALKDPARLPLWAHNGGFETLMSYGVSVTTRVGPDEAARLMDEFRQALPAAHKRFLLALTDSFACGGYFFAHAGVRPGVPLEAQDREDLLWIREEFTGSSEDFGAVVVHGHTPAVDVEVRPNRINIDTGAYLTNRLTCLVLEGDRVEVIGPDGASAPVRGNSARRSAGR